MKKSMLQSFEQLSRSYVKNILPDKPMLMVGMGTCGIGNGADVLYRIIDNSIRENKLDCLVKPTGCFGFCAEEPLVSLYQPGKPLLVYSRVTEKEVLRILNGAVSGKIYTKNILCRIESWDHLTTHIEYGKGYESYPLWHELPFFKGQKKIVLRNAGFINPESIEDYLAVGGYQALAKVLATNNPQAVIDEVLDAGMRGRGGAGYPTGKKWDMMRHNEAPKKYIICNADEGDPGAYMNRNEIESDPHSILEGMMIGAFAMGADEGIAYVRAEYPLAVKRFEMAAKQAEAMGLMGNNILDSGFSFKFDIVEGAGAFVCGEETALIASIEGKAGRPMPRPPYPAAKGLYGCPTNINNVETWCNIPVIIEKGSAWFRQTGTEKSPGTKVFSLVGKIKNTGLVELPLGSTLEQFIFEIGEGTGTNKRVKFVFNTQLGKDITLDTLENQHDAVYLAIGAWKETGLHIPGEDAKGVFAGTEVLKMLAVDKQPALGQQVVIIGAGNVAIDAARSLWRLGKEVTIVYRREKCDMPANHAEIKESEAEKINFHFMSAPSAVLTDDKNRVRGLKIELMTCGGLDTSGRRKPVPTGKFDEIPCDSVILAIGEQVEDDQLKENGINTLSGGRIVINHFTQQTSRNKVYAGGDAVTGPSTAAEAMGMARKAAEAIDAELMQEKRFHLLFRKFTYRNVVPANPKKAAKNVSYKLAVRDRVGNFHEVDCGYTGEQARNEVGRCLRCDVRL